MTTDVGQSVSHIEQWAKFILYFLDGKQREARENYAAALRSSIGEAKEAEVQAAVQLWKKRYCASCVFAEVSCDWPR